jgi:hypothetical protein
VTPGRSLRNVGTRALVATVLLGLVGSLLWCLARSLDEPGHSSAPLWVDETAAGKPRTTGFVNITGLKGEARCIFIDMEGRELRRMPGGGCDFFSDGKAIAWLDDDLVVFDEDLEVFWRKPMYMHHALSVVDGDRILVMTSEEHAAEDGEDLWDAIVLLSKDGDELFRWSTWDHVEELAAMMSARCAGAQGTKQFCSSPGPLKGDSPEAVVQRYREGPVTHMNTAKLLPDNPHYPANPAFRPGNILTSCSVNGFIAIIDIETGAVVWSYMLEDSWYGQHTPEMQANGNIVMFVNGRGRTQDKASSAVVELDPTTGEVMWEFRSDPPDAFYMELEGSSQRLPTGNTLVTNWNHAFEVNPAGQVVWQVRHPACPPSGRCSTDMNTAFAQIRRVPIEAVARFLGDGG